MTRPASHLPDRWLLALMALAFRVAVACLAAGVAWWLVRPSDPAALRLLTAGLLALFAMPILRLASILAASARRRDWITLSATLAVAAILLALTLRDAWR